MAKIKKKLSNRVFRFNLLTNSEKMKRIKNKYELFSNEVPIPGLREIITAQHWVISLAWVMIILIGLILTASFIYAVIHEYLDEPTATKVLLLFYCI